MIRVTPLMTLAASGNMEIVQIDLEWIQVPPHMGTTYVNQLFDLAVLLTVYSLMTQLKLSPTRQKGCWSLTDISCEPRWSPSRGRLKSSDYKTLWAFWNVMWIFMLIL